MPSIIKTEIAVIDFARARPDDFGRVHVVLAVHTAAEAFDIHVYSAEEKAITAAQRQQLPHAASLADLRCYVRHRAGRSPKFIGWCTGHKDKT